MRVWYTIRDAIERGETCALVTVLAVRGSAPREAGARMVVTAAGGILGTIGGGALEWQALGSAQRQIGRPGSRAVIERKVLGPDLGQCCGGTVELLVEVFAPETHAHVDALATAEAAGPFVTRANLNGKPHLIRRIEAGGETDAAIARLRGGTITERFGDLRRTVMLFGAGHVGRALMLALAPLPFKVRWVDPRPHAFPSHAAANVTIEGRADVVSTLAAAPEGAFVVIMTHSHALDLAILDAALSAGRFAYVGLIGSATKRARFESRLRKAGHADRVATSFVCPVGISGIGSSLPAAIAAGVACQLLQYDELVKTAGMALNTASQRA